MNINFQLLNSRVTIDSESFFLETVKNKINGSILGMFQLY